jgi:hypothetical protein
MKRFWGIATVVGALLGTVAQAQNAYPPSNILKVGSQMAFELRQQWTGTVAGKDSDGDWQGNARAANGTQGQFVGFAVQGSSNYAFQVGTTTSSEYCILTPSSVSSNSGGVVVYTGSRFSQQGNASPVNDNTACRVTLNNGGGTATQPTQPIQPPTQPPSLPGTTTQPQLPPLTFPPRLEVGQRWEFRLGNRAIVYRSALTAQENRNGTTVYTGTLVTDGAGDPIASRKLEVFFAQDTLAAYATDPQGGVTVCSFQGAASLQNNVLTGVVFYRAPGQQQFQTLTAAADAPCRANLEPVQATVVQPTNPTQPIQPPAPQPQTLTPSVPVQVGDAWRIVANGNIGLEPWTLQFTKSDQDGVSGTATQGTGRGDVSAFKTNDGGYAFLINVNNRLIGCLLVANTPVVNGALLGQLVEIVQVNGQNQVKSLNTSCTASLTARGGSTGGTSIITPPTQTLAASLPVQVGDTWTISASGYQPWTLQFTKLDDGDPAGTVTQGNARGETFAVKGNDGSHAFLMGIGGRNFYCFIQPNTRFQGSSILGGLGEFIGTGNNAQAQSLNTPCTATLTARGGSTQPTASLTASFPPKPGQTWTLTIDGLAPWTMVFDKTNQDGVSGRATQNGVSGNTFAFVDGGENWFQVSGGNLIYFCIFPARPQVSGASLVGGQAFSASNPNAQLTRLNRACTATLTNQTLLSLYKTKFEREKMPIKLSPLF